MSSRTTSPAASAHGVRIGRGRSRGGQRDPADKEDDDSAEDQAPPSRHRACAEVRQHGVDAKEGEHWDNHQTGDGSYVLDLRPSGPEQILERNETHARDGHDDQGHHYPPDHRHIAPQCHHAREDQQQYEHV